MEKIKLTMLCEFEKQFNKIFNKFSNNEISSKECINAINSLIRAWDFTRVDIKNVGSSSNTIRFLEHDKKLKIIFPKWFSDKKGTGCVIQWPNKDVNFMFRCFGEGKLKIYLKGVDFRDIDNNRIPIYINFKKMTINMSVDFEKNMLTWHDKPYIFEKTCEDSEVFFIDLKYDTLFDYFPQLKIRVSNQLNYNEICQFYLEINKYIQNEKSLLKINSVIL